MAARTLVATLFLAMIAAHIPALGYAITYEYYSSNNYYTVSATGEGYERAFDTTMSLSGTFKIDAKDIAPNVAGEIITIPPLLQNPETVVRDDAKIV